MDLEITKPSAEAKAKPLATEATSSADVALAASLGIIPHMTQTYAVGEFRYTSFADAVAQARRVAKATGTAA